MRTKFSGMLTLLLAFVVQLTFAQEKTISGNVTDNSGLPLPGVNIVVKGTSSGTQSDFDGNYSIKAAKGAVVTFSYVGFATKEIAVGDGNTINVKLTEDTAQLEEVVVTAQGIRREKKALGYAVATIAADDISSKPQTDVVRALTGKAPGVNITQTSGLSGSGTNIIIRGYSSINGSNQPLFVVDGVPFNSNANPTNNFVGGGAAASSRFLDLDPNNIKEISVLKGLSATTLYGQAGRNGVVLVTTKTGTKSDSNKKFEITVNQSYFTNQIANLPDYQDNYGNGFYQNYSQAFSNWGPNFNVRGQQGVAADGTVPHPYDRDALATAFPEFQGARYEYRPYDSVEDFFTTGSVITTSVSTSGSSENSNYSINFGRTEDEGFIPTNEYNRLNFSAGGSTKLSNKFTVSSSFNYVRTDRVTPPTAVGFGSNPAGASLFANVLYTPRSVDLFGLPYENPLDNSSVYYRGGNDIQNPLWTLNNIKDTENIRRFFGNITTSYQINDWLNLSYRLSLDSYNQKNERTANKGGQQVQGGAYNTWNLESTIWDHTLSLNFDKDISDRFNISGTIGLNPRNEVFTGTFTNSTQQFVYGIFTHQNFEETTASTQFQEFNILGAYASATLGYDNFLFLNLQGRNDWFSSLPRENRAIFYPSASLSFVPTSAIEALKGSKAINYLKLRVGFGSSAGFPNPYSSIIGLGAATNVFDSPTGGTTNTLSISNALGNPNLKPELITELEAGIETRLFDNRIGFDLSVYDKKSTDLILQNKQLDPATGYTVTSDNLGEVTNKGLEVGFNLNPIRPTDSEGFRWDISGQYTINENIVEDNGDAPGSITVFAGFGNQGNAAISGEAYGVIVGTSIARDANGNFIVGADGNYVADNALKIIGDPNADWRTTIINEFTYKNFSLNAQVEYTHGGDIFSTTASALLSRGLTTDTDFDRTQTFILPGVDLNGAPNTTQIAATDLGFVNSGFFIDEQSVYDASTIRLREISLSYDFPKRFLDQTPFGKVSIRIIGQNMWYKAINFPDGLNFDPEVTSLGVGNGQGFDYLTGPTAKRYGFSLNLTF
ncbi:SusC/RagA family TonB-linked outer membrane protein [Aquimarina sp. 2201CG5-10]|uniref:SusC/RagA family TonB-linked outer membrane protein n=1 Tax=Aquimarina callyspongiae TaxID=3098150 RepID=UPI002AB4D24F|nr:SusC/RagA family TonB-linked outer membrane protein [Aquimarina sp. 2201CG5-10]MDY8134431.1 SusC/RagA family TonB-linked outer membrane protein [Aquimarina sp. 2201CG5-10]